jgi:hypothetical protein
MAPPTTAPPPRPGQQVSQVGFSGKRWEIINAVRDYPWPQSWGPAAVVSEWVLASTPEGESWCGVVTVTSYRTAPNHKGSGTAYLSVRWSPEG